VKWVGSMSDDIGDQIALVLRIAEGLLVPVFSPHSSLMDEHHRDLFASARAVDLSPVAIAEAFVAAERDGWPVGFEDQPAVALVDGHRRQPVDRGRGSRDVAS
jgi:hypothetical protein